MTEMTRSSRRKSNFLIHLTARELESFLAHVDPQDALEDLLKFSEKRESLVAFEFDDEAAGIFLDALEQTANSAQNSEAMEQLGNAFARISAGIDGTADPGAHLLRPAAACRGYTPLQGRYLGFIHYFQKIHGQSPAESDFQRYFQATAPVVHAAIVMLQRRGFITRTPGAARSIKLLVPSEEIPALD